MPLHRTWRHHLPAVRRPAPRRCGISAPRSGPATGEDRNPRRWHWPSRAHDTSCNHGNTLTSDRPPRTRRPSHTSDRSGGASSTADHGPATFAGRCDRWCAAHRGVAARTTPAASACNHRPVARPELPAGDGSHRHPRRRQHRQLGVRTPEPGGGTSPGRRPTGRLGNGTTTPAAQPCEHSTTTPAAQPCEHSTTTPTAQPFEHGTTTPTAQPFEHGTTAAKGDDRSRRGGGRGRPGRGRHGHAHGAHRTDARCDHRTRACGQWRAAARHPAGATPRAPVPTSAGDTIRRSHRRCRIAGCGRVLRCRRPVRSRVWLGRTGSGDTGTRCRFPRPDGSRDIHHPRSTERAVQRLRPGAGEHPVVPHHRAVDTAVPGRVPREHAGHGLVLGGHEHGDGRRHRHQRRRVCKRQQERPATRAGRRRGGRAGQLLVGGERRGFGSGTDAVAAEAVGTRPAAVRVPNRRHPCAGSPVAPSSSYADGPIHLVGSLQELLLLAAGTPGCGTR